MGTITPTPAGSAQSPMDDRTSKAVGATKGSNTKGGAFRAYIAGKTFFTQKNPVTLG